MIWKAIESIATVASVVVTAAMAGMTYWTIRETRKNHKDEYRPILLLAPEGAADPVRRQDMLTAEPGPPNHDRFFGVHGILSNIGKGPALNVEITLRFQGIEGYGVSSEISPLGAGERLDFSKEPMRLLVSFRNDFNDADFHYGPGSVWEILIEYQDVFGQYFHTVHSKDPQRPWTRLGTGMAPKGRDPRQDTEIMRAMAQANLARASEEPKGGSGPVF